MRPAPGRGDSEAEPGASRSPPGQGRAGVRPGRQRRIFRIGCGAGGGIGIGTSVSSWHARLRPISPRGHSAGECLRGSRIWPLLSYDHGFNSTSQRSISFGRARAVTPCPVRALPDLSIGSLTIRAMQQLEPCHCLRFQRPLDLQWSTPADSQLLHTIPSQPAPCLVCRSYSPRDPAPPRGDSEARVQRPPEIWPGRPPTRVKNRGRGSPGCVGTALSRSRSRVPGPNNGNNWSGNT